MSGARGPREASEALGISTMRYFTLEDRALQGMVLALEPRPRGRRRPSPDDVLQGVQREREVLRRELGRTQALLRLVRKSVKLREPEEKGSGKDKRRRAPEKHATKLLARLREPVQVLAGAGAQA
jgi:hypothetical protein